MGLYFLQMHKLFTIQLNFRPVKLKALADDKINVTEPLNFVLGRAENIVEKEKMLVTTMGRNLSQMH